MLFDSRTRPLKAGFELAPMPGWGYVTSPVETASGITWTFSRGDFPVFAYYHPSHLDADWLVKPVTGLTWLGNRFKFSKPVLIDPITARIYRIVRKKDYPSEKDGIHSEMPSGLSAVHYRCGIAGRKEAGRVREKRCCSAQTYLNGFIGFFLFRLLKKVRFDANVISYSTDFYQTSSPQQKRFDDMSQIQYILMDVDGTMTGLRKPGSQMMKTSPMGHLENLIMKKHGGSREEAHRRICGCGDTAVQCLSEFLPMLEIDPQDYFNVMAEDLSHFIFVTEDTVRFFHYLKEKGIGLFTATTNSPFMTRVKLSVGGIADLNGCPFLSGYFPGCMFKDPEGKYSAAYYPDILKHSGFDPEKVMMIGDEPVRDMLPALRAGIRYGVNIDRTQKEDWFRKDGGIYVRSLDVLTELMEKQSL